MAYKNKEDLKRYQEKYRKDPINKVRQREWQKQYLSRPDKKAKHIYHRLNYDSKRLGYAVVNITLGQFTLWYLKQELKCMWCKSDNKLSVDHNHNTGEVRGLKCQSCNIVEGHITNNGGFEYLKSVYNGYIEENEK